MTKKVNYNCFAECAEYTLDQFWKHLFEDCAKGKFPRGSSIDSQGTTVYFKGKQTLNTKNYISYKMIPNNAPENFKNLKKLFQEHLNYKSNQDRQDLVTEVDDKCNDLKEDYTQDWQNIKRKKVKDPIIRRYILDLKEQYNLSDKETSEVAQILKIGFLFNWISNENVIYNDQKIKDIVILSFDAEERMFKLTEPAAHCKREYKPKINKMSSLWESDKPKNRYIL